MKENHSHEYCKDILRVNRLLQSSLLEMRYHCEVYKLSLQCINKILHTNNTDLRAFSAANIIDDENVFKYSAKSNYQRNVALISQRRALSKISVVLKKAKTYLRGYNLVEKTECLPLVLIEPSPHDQPVEVNSKITDDQLNSALLDYANQDLLQDSTSKLIQTDTQSHTEDNGSQKSNEILLQDTVPNEKTLSVTEGFFRDSGRNKETLLSLKTSLRSSELSEQDYGEVKPNETLGEKISLEWLQVSQPQKPQEPQKYIRESSVRYHGRKDNRSHAEIKGSVESNATCDLSKRISKSSTRRTRWDNGSQVASGKDRSRSGFVSRNAAKQISIFKGNNITMNRRNNIPPSNLSNSQAVVKGLPAMTCPPVKVDMNFINSKRNQVLRKYENMRLASKSNHRTFKDPFYQSKKWALEFHQKRGQLRLNQKARGHEFIIGSSSSVSFKGTNLHPIVQSIPTLTMPRRTLSRLDSVIKPPRIDVYPLSHEKIWELLPVSLHKAVTQIPDTLCGPMLQNPPVATASLNSQREIKLPDSIPLVNPPVVVSNSVSVISTKPNIPVAATHVSTFLEDPRLKKRRAKSQVTGESDNNKQHD